jgi:hypothetical protein
MLERGLEAAQSSGPTPEQLQALERRVLAGLGATALATTAVTMAKTAGAQGAGAAAGWLSAGSAKLVVTLVATVTVGGGSVAVWQAVNAKASRSAAVAQPARVSARAPERRLHPELPATVQSPAPAPETPAPVQAPPPLSAGTGPAFAPSPLAPAPIVAGWVNTDRPTLSQATARPSRPALPPPASARFLNVEATRAASGQAERETVDEELSLLARANRARAKSPALALTLADEHARRFPDSGMEQECELIAITALVDLGQTGEAQRRAARFARAHPGSVYQSRIDKALAPTR